MSAASAQNVIDDAPAALRSEAMRPAVLGAARAHVFVSVPAAPALAFEQLPAPLPQPTPVPPLRPTAVQALISPSLTKRIPETPFS